MNRISAVLLRQFVGPITILLFEVGFTFTAVIVSGGRDILFLETDLGTTLLVKATRI